MTPIMDQHLAVRRFLAEPASYPARPRSVELIETHISCVFVADSLVYKLKKPVRFEFVDFSTLAARHAACLEEVRLNRRLAPAVYLGVLPITAAADGALALDGEGQPVDWVVQMLRLPTDRTLEARVRSGTVSHDEVAELSRVLGDFYAAAPPVAIDAVEYRREIEHHVRANREELLAASSTEQMADVRRAHAAQLQLLMLRPELFDDRVRRGRIIDGHGDLRPEHICLTAPPVVFDCLEFDARLRQLDVADELSFLAMECERLGAAEIGRKVRDACLARCGDDPPAALLKFYESYRACVRAKVAALRRGQLSAGADNPLAREASDDLRLAARDARDFSRPIVLVASGLMGSGKSTVATALAETFGVSIVSTDALRRELFGASRQAEKYNAGAYAPENRQRVYEELFGRAEAFLNAGESVVLDGTFLSAGSVRRILSLAGAAGARLLVIRCRCDELVARQRIPARLAAGTDLSEARPELFDKQRAEVDEIPAEVAHLVLDTTGSLADQVQRVVKELRKIVRR